MDSEFVEQLSRLERKALQSGEWILVRDEATLRSCFYNTVTHETALDLKKHLLLSSYRGGVPKSRPEEPRAIQRTFDSASEELQAARQLLLAYEKELAQLRHCLLVSSATNGGYGTSSVSQIAPVVSVHVPSDAAVGAAVEEIRNLRQLNQELYQRVVNDRQQRFICASCCEVSATAMLTSSLRPNQQPLYPDQERNASHANRRREEAETANALVMHSSNAVAVPSISSLQHYGVPDEHDTLLFRSRPEKWGAPPTASPATPRLSDTAPQYLSPAFTKTNYITTHAPLRTSSLFPKSLHHLPSSSAHVDWGPGSPMGLVPRVTPGHSVAGETPPGLVLRSAMELPPRISLSVVSPMRR